VQTREATKVNSNNHKVLIFLATRNGELFINEQIESIIHQSFMDWVLLIRDDVSTDNTLSLLKKWCSRDSRIQILDNLDEKSGSALNNFSKLIFCRNMFAADYYCFCDQDDVWAPDKLSKSLKALVEIEKDGVFKKLPALVHSDLEVVDRDLNTINRSFVAMMRLRPSSESMPARLLSRNEVTGCTLMCNKALLEVANPIPTNAIMHDWWLALVAAYTGRVRFLDETLVHYRQHSQNVIGAKSFWQGLNPFNNCFVSWRKGNLEILRSMEQSALLFSHLKRKKILSKQKLEEINSYSQLGTMSIYQRLKAAINMPIWRSHWLLNLVLFFRLNLLPRQNK
jgi:glycosyltransferase involved in cell wall biosynthesis